MTVAAAMAFCLLIGRPAISQTLDADTKFRLAQGLEASGEFEHAARMYGELYLRDPSNPVIADALQRVLVQLKHYDEAAAVIRNRLALTPADPQLRGQLGSVYYRAGREQEAMREWEAILAAEPANLNRYRILANVLIENRLLDRAVDVYRRGRVAAGDSAMFAVELAQLMIATMDYSGATGELLTWLGRNPSQLAYVQNRLATFTGKADGRLAAIEAVRTALREKEDARRYELLSWLYLEGKDFEQAFEAARGVDRLGNRQGTALLDFGDRAYRAGAYDVAIRALREAVNTPLPAARIPAAKYGIACALKEEGLQSDSVRGPFMQLGGPGEGSLPALDRAITAFREVIDNYPRTEFSAKSWYQIGVLQADRFFNLDGGLQSLERAAQELAGVTVVRQQIHLKIGQIRVIQGDTARAAEEFRNVAVTASALPDQQDEANFRLAELDFFAGRFEAASARLASIALNVKDDFANDAIELQSFLAENQMTPQPVLGDYARAALLARQRRNSEAIALYEKASRSAPQAPLADDALFAAATLQAHSGRFVEAAAGYERLLNEFKEQGTLLDRAQFRIGEVYQFGLRDAPRAITAYEKLLADYPSSVLGAEARKRIRQLRGEVL